MPIHEDFKQRLYPIIPEINKTFGTPYIIYDEKGIIYEYRRLSQSMKGLDYRNFFAVKATPEPEILKLLIEMGCGFDCSSIHELRLVRKLGAKPGDIMFTSNNTSTEEFKEALKNGGCILNLDDISLIDKIHQMPELICFRYNPGNSRTGNAIIGNPVEAKYGVPHEKIIEAYQLAKEKGATKFGLHTMICSNELNYEYIVETVEMLKNIALKLHNKFGIKLEFINIGGGIGIPYYPDQYPVNIEEMGRKITQIIEQLGQEIGCTPKLFTEFGRYITGSHAVLVMKVINVMEKYRKYIGMDACMTANMRPAMYGAYHHIDVLGNNSNFSTEIVDVVGSLCENNDKFAVQRELPKIKEGDILIQHDVGAHAVAMGFNYNGRLKPQILLINKGGTIVCIRRAQVPEDLDATLTGGNIGKTIQI